MSPSVQENQRNETAFVTWSSQRVVLAESSDDSHRHRRAVIGPLKNQVLLRVRQIRAEVCMPYPVSEPRPPPVASCERRRHIPSFEEGSVAEGIIPIGDTRIQQRTNRLLPLL